MRRVAFVVAVAAAGAAFGGFWDVMNKVQQTVETAAAVSELVNGQRQPAQPQVVEQPQTAEQPYVAPPVTPEPVAAVDTVVPSAPEAPVVAPEAQPKPAAPVLPAEPVAAAPAAAPAVDAAAFAAQCTTATDTAVPAISSGIVKFTKPATPAQIKEAKDAFVAGGREISEAGLDFEKGVDDATVAAAIAAFPEAWSVTVKDARLSTMAPFALLGEVKRISFSHVPCADAKPFAGCANLMSLEMKYCDISDLSGFGGLQSLERINLYGSKVTCSFAPLAGCASLEAIDFYAVKGPKETYDSLGALKQVKEFKGGLTKMTSLKWLLTCPQTEVLEVFSENIDDFSPISSLPNLVRFRGWKMDGGSMASALGDLSFLSPCKKLQKLELPGSAYSNTAVIGTLTELEELDISSAAQPVDVSFVASLPKLTRLTVRGTEVVNGASIPASVRISKDNKTKGL